MFYEPNELRCVDKAIISTRGCKDEERALYTPESEMALLGAKKPRRFYRGGGGWIDPKLTAIYVIGNGTNDLCKVGYSRNLKARLSAMQTGSPVPITLAHFVYVAGGLIAKRIEATVHHALRDRQVHGEWFDVPPSYAAAMIYAAIKDGSYAWWDERGMRDIGRLAHHIYSKDCQRMYRMPRAA